MKPVNLSFPEDSTLQDVYNYLCENESLYVYIYISPVLH